MPVLRFVVLRLLAALTTLVGVAALVFIAIHAAPGGYADVVLGPEATAPPERTSRRSSASTTRCRSSS